MTIGTTISSITVQGNGVTTSFAYPFLMPNAAFAVVTYTPNGGPQQVLTATEYTITGIGNAAGGTITFPLSGLPITSGSFITIQRILPLIQATSLGNQGPTFAAIESALDYLTMEIQQVQAEEMLNLTGNISDPPGLTYEAAPVAQRASQALGWDVNGNLTTNAFTSVAVSSAMQPVVAASSVALALSLMDGVAGAVADTGIVNVLTISLPWNPGAISALLNLPICIIPNHTNTSTASLQANFTTAEAIVRVDGTPCVGGELQQGQPTWVMWNGTAYRLFTMGPSSAAAVEAGTDAHSAITPAALLAAMPFLAASPGYFELPNGIIVNFGTTTSGGGGTTVVTWAKAFPNAILMQPIGGALGATTSTITIYSGAMPTASGADFVTNVAGSPASVEFGYVVIGY